MSGVQSVFAAIGIVTVALCLACTVGVVLAVLYERIDAQCRKYATELGELVERGAITYDAASLTYLREVRAHEEHLVLIADAEMRRSMPAHTRTA